jgi:hypothetical protein
MRPSLTKEQRAAIRAHNINTGQRISSRYAADLVETVLNPIFLAASVPQLEIPSDNAVAKARCDRQRNLLRQQEQQRLQLNTTSTPVAVAAASSMSGRGGRGGRGGGSQATPIDDMLKALVKSAVKEAIREELPGFLRTLEAQKAATPVSIVAEQQQSIIHAHLLHLLSSYHLSLMFYHNLCFTLQMMRQPRKAALEAGKKKNIDETDDDSSNEEEPDEEEPDELEVEEV